MRYRLSMAKERLDSSKLLLEHASYKDSIGRSYYAMFTAFVLFWPWMGWTSKNTQA